MIVAHVGLDGSGKSYGMAQDAKLAMARERKKSTRKKSGRFCPCRDQKKFITPTKYFF